jgi:hypothetical protein
MLLFKTASRRIIFLNVSGCKNNVRVSCAMREAIYARRSTA